MAKTIKPKTIKKVTKAKKVTVSKNVLVAVSATTSQVAIVSVEFKSGLGQITASLFRKGVLINMQSISTSGDVSFSDVQSGDAISINGICAGTAQIVVNIPTLPATPENFKAQLILTGYIIL